MDDDAPTIKFPAYRHTSESDDTPVKIPAQMRHSMTTLENRQEISESETPSINTASVAGDAVAEIVSVAASTSPDPIIAQAKQEAEPELPVLEYEYIWDSPTSSLPATASFRQQNTKKRWPTWARVALTIFVLLLVVASSTLAYSYYYFDTNVQKPLARFIHPVSRAKDELATSSSAIPSDSNVSGRVWNILLLGSDDDGKYSFPALLTQVMMIVHIDTINNTVTMVSIPRDSWVHVPEVDSMHKIDQAFLVGAIQRNSFDDGVRLARLTIEEDYGITIDRYAWVGLNGFAKVIDTLGGLDIDVTHPIVDDVYPDDTGPRANEPDAYKRLYIAAGPQHLNGLEALEYVRSRHGDLVGDLGRTQRQQQVLQALKQKLNLNSILNNLPQLFADLTGSVYTDLTEKEMLGFVVFGRGLDSKTIQHITLGPGQGSQNYGDFGQVYDPSAGGEQDIVIPHCENIQPLMNRIFGLGNKQSCNVNG